MIKKNYKGDFPYLDNARLKFSSLLFIAMLSSLTINAQNSWTGSVAFDEADFPAATTALQTGPGTTQYCYDFLVNNGAGPSGSFIYATGQDGTDDMCVDVTVVENCGGWQQVDGDWDATSNGSFRSDYTAGTANGTNPATCSAPNCNGFVKFDFTFINGLETSVSACNFSTRHTSTNGGSEGYEWTEIFLNGTAPANAEAMMQAYTNMDYNEMSGCTNADLTTNTVYDATTIIPNNLTMSEFITSSPSGTYAPGGNVQAGWWAVDDFNTDIFCGVETSTNGGNPLTGNGGPNDNQTIGGSPAVAGTDGDFGFADNDLVSQVTYYFGLTDVSFDTDGDGCTEMNTLPSAGVTEFDLGFKAPCEFPEPVITLEEDCGIFNIVVGPIDESSASGNGTVVTYDTANNDPWTSTTAVTGAEALTADGTDYYVNIADADDAACNNTFGPFSIVGTPGPTLTVACPGPIDICAGTTVPLPLTDSSGGAMAVYGGSCAAYVNDNGTATDVTDDFIDPAGATPGTCSLTVQLVDANGCDSGTPVVCNVVFETNCDADGGQF